MVKEFLTKQNLTILSPHSNGTSCTIAINKQWMAINSGNSKRPIKGAKWINNQLQIFNEDRFKQFFNKVVKL
jgi:hypothetical protein